MPRVVPEVFFVPNFFPAEAGIHLAPGRRHFGFFGYRIYGYSGQVSAKRFPDFSPGAQYSTAHCFKFYRYTDIPIRFLPNDKNIFL
jgi:hypothetical protein